MMLNDLKDIEFINSLVSIITPTYNSEEFVGKTIESIQNQSYENWELLITDDCSTDGTWQIINSYANSDNRIKVFKLEKNSGAGIARNNSIKHAKGKYIAFCDSDDKWKKLKLQHQIKFMQENNVYLSYTDYEVVDELKNLVKIVHSPLKVTYKEMLKNDYIGFSTFIYDSEKLGKRLLPSIRKRQDWALKLSILREGINGFGVNEVLVEYMKRKNSISSNKFKVLKYIWNVYKEEEKMPLYKALYFMITYSINYKLKTLKYHSHV